MFGCDHGISVSYTVSVEGVHPSGMYCDTLHRPGFCGTVVERVL